MKVAIALELIHMATLVHDDVIDYAATRRGVPTANALWGKHSAVLSGDFLFARAFSLIASLGLQEVTEVLSDVLSSLCEGELQQEQDLFYYNQTEANYYSRVGKKTADFIAASSQLGAAVGGFGAQQAESLRRYGYALGMAFQITDDILDVIATPKQLGKPTGNDLRQGNLTLPVIHALAHSPRSHELRAIIESRDMSEKNIEICLSIVRDGDAIRYSYEMVNCFLQEARDTLPKALDGQVRSALSVVADSVGFRKY